MANKKIKNANPKEYNGIKFRSRTEVEVYKTFLQYGFCPLYEKVKYTLWEGIKPTVATYKPDKFGNLQLQTKKLQNITYTPDFVLYLQDNKVIVIIEVKGHPNDAYPIKEKMFRKLLEQIEKYEKKKVVFIQIKNKSQTLEAINIINTI